MNGKMVLALEALAVRADEARGEPSRDVQRVLELLHDLEQAPEVGVRRSRNASRSIPCRPAVRKARGLRRRRGRRRRSRRARCDASDSRRGDRRRASPSAACGRACRSSIVAVLKCGCRKLRPSASRSRRPPVSVSSSRKILSRSAWSATRLRPSERPVRPRDERQRSAIRSAARAASRRRALRPRGRASRPPRPRRRARRSGGPTGRERRAAGRSCTSSTCRPESRSPSSTSGTSCGAAASCPP